MVHKIPSKVVDFLKLVNIGKKIKIFFGFIIFIVLIFGLFIINYSLKNNINGSNLNQSKIMTTDNIYVSNTSKKSGKGTYEYPFHTISEALKNVKKGSNVIIRKGIYKEKLKLQQSGKKNAWISISNYPGEEVIIDGSDLPLSSDMEGLVTIKNKSFVQIKGIIFKNFLSHDEKVPVGILVEGRSHNVVIDNCSVTKIVTKNHDAKNANAHGIAVYGNDDEAIHDIFIKNNKVFKNKLGLSEAVVLNGNIEKFKISNNRVFDNNNIGIDFIGFEKTANKNDYVRNGFCTGNLVWNNSTKKNPSYLESSSAGIYVDGGRDIIIEKNKVYNCDIGIEAASEHGGKETKKILIRNNIIYDCNAISGIAFGGYDDSKGAAKDVKIINNTMYHNDTHILIQAHAQYDSNVIANNILYKGKAFSGNLSHIKRSQNFTTNPKFVAENDYNFSLSKFSPALDVGIMNKFVGSEDFYGKKRVVNGKVNVGAIQ